MSYGLTNADTSRGRFGRQFVATSRDGGKHFLGTDRGRPADQLRLCRVRRRDLPRRLHRLGMTRGRLYAVWAVLEHHPGPARDITRSSTGRRSTPPAAPCLPQQLTKSPRFYAPDRRSLVLPPPGLDGQDLRASRSDRSARRRLAGWRAAARTSTPPATCRPAPKARAGTPTTTSRNPDTEEASCPTRVTLTRRTRPNWPTPIRAGPRHVNAHTRGGKPLRSVRDAIRDSVSNNAAPRTRYRAT